jgi:hypothetical protein
VNPSQSEVLIITVYDWHRAILNPLVERFQKWHDVSLCSVDAIAAGWRPQRTPDLVIVCDAGVVQWLRTFFAESLFMHVGHGLISKNRTLHTYMEPDFICVASEQIVERLTGMGHVPRRRFFATGLIQSDPLFRVTSGSKSFRPSTAGATVVYAPTWNESLTSAGMFGENLVECIRGLDSSVQLLIKPHPHIAVVRPDWIEMWTQLSEDNLNVKLCDPDSDLIPTLIEGDVLVSDASSAIFHFLALNRPIVLVNNPQRFGDLDVFDPDGIEWQWRDVAHETDDVNEVASAIRESLRNPSQREMERTRRRRELFGDHTDGQSCERVHSAAIHVLEKYR